MAIPVKKSILAIVIASLQIAVTIAMAIAGILVLNTDPSTKEADRPGASPLDRILPDRPYRQSGQILRGSDNHPHQRINTVVMGFVDLILSTTKAIESIFSGWAKTIGIEWFG